MEGGTRLTENLAGTHFPEYDGYLVLSHFKGHAMAGFGGTIKNISIGMASQEGKCLIHTAYWNMAKRSVLLWYFLFSVFAFDFIVFSEFGNDLEICVQALDECIPSSHRQQMIDTAPSVAPILWTICACIFS